jgi:hypothetical protein
MARFSQRKLFCPKVTAVSAMSFKLGFSIIFFFPIFFLHQEPPIKVGTMVSSILEAMQRDEVMRKHWDCKLMFKEEEDAPEIDLLDYINLS